ncbi:hypothetical protein NA57DRAFT_68708 [Rhizodiscina lignyota]|uniref:Meiotically up-regulated gene 154 protein n=1 Tax=Rhizodiscina lignyota TaxID=1504668 RepID=A0A9P4M1Z3_9PEZI|nr:hypothetical protein NA57DRAFT_68708 [Rhizodiscina lignyota]
MPRLVRRTPLGERIKNYIWDTLLWASEELNSDEWENAVKEWVTPIGLALNFIFLLARANVSGQSKGSYDVFGDYEGRGRSGWLQWLLTLQQCSTFTFILAAASFLNAFYTFARKRHYRLFEASVDTVPSTPSARRVRVDSSPAASSPLRFLSNILASANAGSRAHADATHDVWEIAVWDPTPLCLRLFCLFSPGHILIYWFFLPVAPLDPRPSLTIVTTLLLTTLLSIQLSFLHTSFSQQMKDQAVISREVLHEYDTKYVHPALNRPVRDVGTQTPFESTEHPNQNVREVETYKPTTIINRGFHTNPNPAYSAQYDPDNVLQSSSQYQVHQPRRLVSTPPLRTPMNGYAVPAPSTTSTATGADFSSPIRQQYQRYPSPQKGTGDGGSLGVYTHAASPLRKVASTNYLRTAGDGAEDGRRKKEGSPLKRSSTPGGGVDRRILHQRPKDSSRDAGRRESGYF